MIRGLRPPRVDEGLVHQIEDHLTVKEHRVHSERSVTSMTLLNRAKADEPEAWAQLDALYRPLVYFWCRKSLDASDAEDMVQDVMAIIARKLKDFQHNGRPGAFRAWMRTIAQRLIIDRYRRPEVSPPAAGGTTANRKLQQVLDDPPADPTEDELSEEVVLLYHRAVELIRNEFSIRDNEIFRRVVENEETPANVAQDMGLTANTVSIVVSRIKKRLRDRFGDAIND